MNKFTLSGVFLALSSCLFSPVIFAETNNEQNDQTTQDENILVVTAELRETNVLELPSSVTVIGSETIKRNNAQHFSDLLNLAPNVNFATGASRGRFVQIRGVGERSEFAEPVNYSVGVVVDGIDLTGIATAATMLDIQQVEILRGPQGTLYGANGLAGLINIVSNTPTTSFYSQLSAGVENYGGRSLSAVVSDSPTDSLSYRFAAGQYQSDGYMDNIYLNRDDTNNIDESSLRGKIVFQLSDNFSLTTNLFFVDVDNGYDAFSLDSNRNTYSDQPGFDRQQTRAISFKADWEINETYRLEALLSGANSDLEYAYDEDWSHQGICDGLECHRDITRLPYDLWYDYFDSYTRINKNKSIDIRFHSNYGKDQVSWTIGYYFRDQKVNLTRVNTRFEIPEVEVPEGEEPETLLPEFIDYNSSNRFDTKNSALYGQIKMPIGGDLVLTTGLRFENRKADYLDSLDTQFHPDENMWGGKIALENHYEKNKMVYFLVSRGYKAGGFNSSLEIPETDREYETEFMWNYEAGIKGRWLDNKLTMQTSVFYQDRKDIQSKQSLILSNETGLPYSELNPCPCSFNDYLKNAEGGGASYGVELEAKWQASDQIDLYSSVGILKTQYKNFKSYSHDLADQEAIPPAPYDMDGRAFAHSPEYQLVFGSNFFVTDNWTVNAQIEAKDSFYFSDRHEVKSDHYAILNWGLNYQQDNWQVNLFVRNVTDEEIQTRGFGSFANDPRNLYSVKGPYYQFAAPRTFGVTASVVFE